MLDVSIRVLLIGYGNVLCSVYGVLNPYKDTQLFTAGKYNIHANTNSY
jgi:hypothetical protein